jgi:hypothetical protein
VRGAVKSPEELRGMDRQGPHAELFFPPQGFCEPLLASVQQKAPLFRGVSRL